MCVSHTEPAPPPAARKRLRLWEMKPGLHCAVLGTCLSFPDLVKAGLEAGVVPEPDATDYEVHAWFVQSCSEPSLLTRMLDERLDRCWHAAIDPGGAGRGVTRGILVVLGGEGFGIHESGSTPK